MFIRRKKFLELQATILECQHALDHVIDKPEFHQNGRRCESCAALAQSALNRVNREDFFELARDFYGWKAKFRSFYYSVIKND